VHLPDTAGTAARTTSPPTAARSAGSFRDPAGFVFSWQQRIFRALTPAAAAELRPCAADGFLAQLTQAGLLVGSQFVSEPGLLAELCAVQPGHADFVEHSRIAPISFPYEWSVSMLADAGIHTLRLQQALLERGLALKDATAYNIQFVNGRPVFIDLTSIERPPRLDLWYALGQFSRMFTYPLLLQRLRGWDLRAYFLANLDGMSEDRVYGMFGWLARCRPALLLDVTLPHLLSRRAQASPGDGKAVLHKADTKPQAQLVNLQRLEGKLRRLAAGYRPRGVWADYTGTCTYDDQARTHKMALVRQWLEETKPARVLDLGCNTGDYSFLAAAAGCAVTACDGDADAIELLYRRLRAQPAAITPLVVDLSNPSPAIGFRNQERPRFLDRVQPDCVFVLALLHHLLISGNLSVAAVRDWLHELTNRDLILEFVPPDDPQFRRLVQFREDLHGGLTLAACRDVFAERFTVTAETAIAGSPRTLWLLRKR